MVLQPGTLMNAGPISEETVVKVGVASFLGVAPNKPWREARCM